MGSSVNDIKELRFKIQKDLYDYIRIRAILDNKSVADLVTDVLVNLMKSDKTYKSRN